MGWPFEARKQHMLLHKLGKESGPPGEWYEAWSFFNQGKCERKAIRNGEPFVTQKASELR